MNIDLTKKYKTRGGRPVTRLHLGATPWPLKGCIGGNTFASWTKGGLTWGTHRAHPDDLIEDVETTTPVPLLSVDPLLVEYGAFVAAVRLNFHRGNFARASADDFDAWLKPLTPSLHA